MPLFLFYTILIRPLELASFRIEIVFKKNTGNSFFFGILYTQKLGRDRRKLRRCVRRPISHARNNILIFSAFINFEKLILLRSKLITLDQN